MEIRDWQSFSPELGRAAVAALRPSSQCVPRQFLKDQGLCADTIHALLYTPTSPPNSCRRAERGAWGC